MIVNNCLGSTPAENNNTVSDKKNSNVSSHSSQISPNMRFGANKKPIDNNDNKLRVRKDTYQEKVEELDLSRDKGREVKSVIKEAPEKGN